jgi:hypothetical protein
MPVADRRCHTCTHPFRQLIEDLADGRTPPKVIVDMLAAREITAPGRDSIRGHQRRHRASPAVVRRVSQGLEVLDRHAQRLPGPVSDGSPLDVLPMPGTSPADQLLIPA